LNRDIKRHRREGTRFGCRWAIALSVLAVLIPGPSVAQAVAPAVIQSWASQVSSTTGRLHAQINPNSLFTTYHFDFITKAAYDANVAASKDPFTGTSRIPPVSDANIGSGGLPVNVTQLLSGLSPNTAYRYRVVAKNGTGTTSGETLLFITQSTGGGPVLADGRAWEMVSPVDKNGGEVNPPGSLFDGGVLQASAQGGSVTYSSTASFAGGQGAPPASQYLASRVPGGWSTQNLTAPLFSGTYDATDEGVPYQLFSGDLARAILLNGDHCRGEGDDCAVANPPLAGTSAPAGYQNYYLREGGGFTALIGSANAGFLSLDPAEFDLRFAGASADLRFGVLSTCAALTANATEVPLGEGCDPTAQNLYLYAPSTGLSLLNLQPAQATGTPGAELAAQGGAVSSDGSRVYFSLEGDLYLRAGAQTKQVDEDAGGEGSFETASADGSVAYFTKGEHLWRYLAGSDTATDITPSGGVKGVLGTSASGSHVYFQDTAALKLWSGGATATVAPGASASTEDDWLAKAGTARVSTDGTKLLFLSKERLTGYDNTDLSSGEPDSQVFLYDAAGAGTLACLSCNPTNGRPIGPSTIPGSVPNGSTEASTNSYKPRVLSANARRVFFDSRDALALSDTNNDWDAYQWQAQGEGSCGKPGGCLNLVSDGKSAGGARFVDASANGSDAFFLTDGSLVEADPGASDLYDARVGGGFPKPPPPIDCEGDACQPLPSPPTDPTLTTLLKGPGNPGVRFPRERRKRCKKGFVKRKGKCVRKASRNGGKKGTRKGRRR
jgi:hypothetical protein